MTTATAIALVPTTSIETEWMPLTASGDEPVWEVRPDGALGQTVQTGGAKLGSGALLVSSQPIAIPAGTIALSCTPGTTYQTGLAFDVADESHFRVFFVDRGDGSAPGYECAVGEVVDGTFTPHCRVRGSGTGATEVLLTLRFEPGRLEFGVGAETVCAWPGTSLQSGARIGLYSQRNIDASFHRLEVLTPPPAEPQPADQVPAPAAANDLPPLPRREPPSEVERYLHVQRPRSRSVIEFKEPYEVVLDSLYSSIYLNSTLTPPTAPDAAGVSSRSVLLDYRPKRWYREYRSLSDGIRWAKSDVARWASLLAALAGPEPATDDLEGDLVDARKRYIVAQDKLELLASERDVLIQEMRVAGYVVRDDDVPAELAADGYGFYLVGGVSGYAEFHPIPVDPALDLADDPQWSALEKELSTRLSGRLAPTAEARYQSRRDVLADQANFLASIRPELDAIDAELATIDHGTAQAGPRLANIASERARWEHDRQLLVNANNLFRPFDPGDYPIDGLGPGPPNNHAFRQWLAGNQHAFQVFRYDFAAPGENYTAGIDYPNLAWWHHEYQHLTEAKQEDRWEPMPGSEWLGIFAPHHWVHYEWIEHRYTFGTPGVDDPNVQGFFDTGVLVCDAHLDSILPAAVEQVDHDLAKLANNRVGLEARRLDLEEHGLPAARRDFIDEWNRADVVASVAVGERVVHPDADPLTELLAGLEAGGESAKVSTTEFRGDGWFTQDGQRLGAFVAAARRLPHVVVLQVPVFDRDGRVLPEVTNAIVNPAPSASVLALPLITFVETYRTEVVWTGYCLGELSRSVNLFPGEEKEMVLERSTRLAEKREAAKAAEEVATTKQTASFEERLEDELTEKNKRAEKLELKDVHDRKEEVSRVVTDEHTKTDSLSLAIDLKQSVATDTTQSGEARLGDRSGGAKYGAESTTRQSRGGGIGFRATSETADKHKDAKTDAVTVSRNQTAQKSNEESKESTRKSVAHRLRKVASETSAENKVSLSTATSIDYEEKVTEKETVRLRNPNVGRTLNYHFFQLQNVFELRTELIDVQIVLEPGVELVRHSGLTDTRVFDVEEVGKVFYNLDEGDPRMALLAATVARQVVKNYTAYGNGPDALRLADAAPPDAATLQTLMLESPWDPSLPLQESLIAPLRDALAELKARAFRFHATEFLPAQIETVNSGSYYMDAEVGARPATEQYLEDRRDVETMRQQAELRHLQAQTQEKVFFRPIPEAVTELSLDGGDA